MWILLHKIRRWLMFPWPLRQMREGLGKRGKPICIYTKKLNLRVRNYVYIYRKFLSFLCLSTITMHLTIPFRVRTLGLSEQKYFTQSHTPIKWCGKLCTQMLLYSPNLGKASKMFFYTDIAIVANIMQTRCFFPP